MNKPKINAWIIADFNPEILKGYLKNNPSGIDVEVSTPPFGQVMPALIDPTAGLRQKHCDLAIIWTQPEKIIPSFQPLLEFQPVAVETILAEVDRFADAILGIREQAALIIVPSWSISPDQRGYGVLDMKPPFGVRNILMKMNLRLAEKLGPAGNIFPVDPGLWLQRAGEQAFSPKLWYLGKIPFCQEVFKRAAEDIIAAWANARGGARKIVILDADDTLWGGTVGEVGWQNIRLGGHDPAGEALVDFQRALKALPGRGILLALVSKNEEAVVLEALDRHPEMVLKPEDFAGRRINWKDKVENIVEIMRELNLGLASAVFIDNSAFERARIRAALPEVLVPEWPEDQMLYKTALTRLICFDSLAVSAEDRQRHEMMAREREREQLKTQFLSLEDWIRTLAIKVTVEELNAANLPRAAQLLNKTNQMNLATRRMTEAELSAWAGGAGRKLWTLRVSDKLGDYGLTGLVSLAAQGQAGEICDFVLSCRVIGRKIEETMLYLCSLYGRDLGLKELHARFTDSGRNQPCRQFFENSGLNAGGDRFVWDLNKPYPCPEAIEIIRPDKNP